jgi:heme A synthase
VDKTAQSPWLHRFALLTAAAALILIASGAFVTSSREASAAPDVSAPQTLAGAGVHQGLGIGVVALALILAVWLWLADRRVWPRILGTIGFALAGSDAWLPALSPGQAAHHASFASLFFGCVAGVVFLTSPDWKLAPEPVDDRGMHFLRPLAISAPPLVLLQIVLGALYRHKVTSVMWHMAGAMVVSLVTLIACMVVIQQYPSHRPLKGSAVHLMSIVLLQVALGVTAFTMQLLETENTIALAVITGSHVVVGNLTLAASLLFAVQVHRNVRLAAAAKAATP